MAEMAQKENMMGTQKMSKLILATGIPLMVSLFINSLYNFVDSMFVSQVSEKALTALSLAAPVQLLVSALGLGNAVGLNAVISRALGRKDKEEVRRAADAAIFIALCAWVLITILCLLSVKPYFAWQSGGDEVIAKYGVQYLTVCMLFSLGQMGQWVFDRFVIASGRSGLFLFTLSAASVTNLILDPIFIFGLFGVPRLETLGAAMATVIGQTVGMFAGIVINRRWNREIPFGFTLRPDRRSVAHILKVGIPSTLVQVLTSFVGILMNSILIGFSSTAVAVYGICIRINGVATVGIHGITNGLIPIVAYNYGAADRKRVSGAVRWSLLYGTLFYLVFFMVLELVPGWVLRIFDASDYMLQIGIPALRILALAWLVAIPALVISAALQGLSMGMRSMILTMSRQAVLPLAFAGICSRFGSLDLLWSGFVLAELLGIPAAMWLWSGGGLNCILRSFYNRAWRDYGSSGVMK
ncbi:MAG: MATE family efflux transporter [Lachnospiraceae bacterium]|nr:MATE family efflux transporter [Lachnospiraceae bacterium]